MAEISSGIKRRFVEGWLLSGRFSSTFGVLFDGSNIWVTDNGDNTLKKLDQTGAILQTVNVGSGPQYPAFDGTNIWVPYSNDNAVTVVRAATGAIIATVSGGNGLSFPVQATFDGPESVRPATFLGKHSR